MASIILIEDNKEHARLVNKVLSAHGHVVIHADNAINGLALLAADAPQLVLLDIDLPDLDGKTVANRLRRMPHLRHTPIVACSANDSASAQRLAIAYGCDGFIAKPLDIRSFAQEVEKYLQASEQLRQRTARK